MRKMPGPEASATATKMLSVVGLTAQKAERIGVEDEGRKQPGAGKEGQRQADRELRRLGLIARDEEHCEEADRESEENGGERIGNRRLEDARRHQQIKQEDDRERQDQIGQKRQDRVDAPPEVAGREPEGDAD